MEIVVVVAVGTERRDAVVLIAGTVNLVGAGLGGDIDRARATTVFCAGVGGDNANFGGSVHGDRLTDTDSVEVSVLGAVEEDIDRGVARAGDVEAYAASGGGRIGGEVAGEGDEAVGVAVWVGRSRICSSLNDGRYFRLFKLNSGKVVGSDSHHGGAAGNGQFDAGRVLRTYRH